MNKSFLPIVVGAAVAASIFSSPVSAVATTSVSQPTVNSIQKMPTALSKKPPIPVGGIKISPGQHPNICTGPNDNAYGVNYGYYYSKTAKTWIQAPRCLPKWGNLAMMDTQIVKGGKRVTMKAVPDEGSNSALYAPETASITWTYPGKRVSGCGTKDLSCTVIPFPSSTSEWQWGVFNVSMPRTFFIDSQGSNCAGQHLCAGASTQAWGVVGVPPKNSKK